jgi:microtubule-associated protein-like 6
MSDEDDIEEHEFFQIKKGPSKEKGYLDSENEDSGSEEIELHEYDDESEDDGEFWAGDPWERAIREPSGFIKPPLNYDKAPNARLELDYVYGYRVNQCRNNLRYLASGEIVYNAAALGIVMNIQKNTQRFFTKHKDDVTAIAVISDSGIVATGEAGKKPLIFVWNANTLQVVHKFQGHIREGVAALAFS